MNITRLLPVFLVLAMACKQAHDKKNAAEPLYPYPQYIESQIAYVDSAQLGIEMTVQEDGVMIDSGFISRQDFRKLAVQFLDPDPNQASIRNDYEESSFQDLTLESITFTITTHNLELPLQQADILLDPDSKQVKYLVLKKQMKTSSGIAYANLMWRHNMNFQILTTMTEPGGKERSKLIRVVWDKPVHELMR